MRSYGRILVHSCLGPLIVRYHYDSNIAALAPRALRDLQFSLSYSIEVIESSVSSASGGPAEMSVGTSKKAMKFYVPLAS